MDLFLIRHAIAVERRPDLLDAERPLTERGRDRFGKVVSALERAKIRFDRVYSSPWKRAMQTAELLESINEGSMVVADGLATTPSLEFFSSVKGGSVACVGHEPWMSEAVALLCLDEIDGDWLRFKKGGVAWLRGSPGSGAMELHGFWPPRLLLNLS